MRAVLAVLAVPVALAAAVALASTSAAGPTAPKQRVQIDHKYPGQTFVLTPLERGALEPDSSTQSCAREPSQHEILRDGQTGWIWDCPTLTFVGKRGKLVLRSRYTWIEAGGPYNIATGTWKVVSGTGQYAGLAGSGRSARVGTTSLERARYQGYVSST
jgi:hypothetical protein